MQGSSAGPCGLTAAWVTAFRELFPSSWAHHVTLSRALSPHACFAAQTQHREMCQAWEDFTAFGETLITTLFPGQFLQAQANHVKVKNTPGSRECISARHQFSLLYCQVVLTPTKPPQPLWELWWCEFAGTDRGTGPHTAPMLSLLYCKRSASPAWSKSSGK